MSNTKKFDPVGEYSLQGVPEMAAGFRLQDDGTFQFFYIYGASDRAAQGSYVVDGDTIILNGSKQIGKDFRLVSERKSGKGTTVVITDPNKVLVANVVCFFTGPSGREEMATDQKGLAQAKMEDCHRIELIHGYFPDQPTVLNLEGNKNNRFELALNPSLAEVVFDNFVMETEGDVLTCSNIYLFGSHKARFHKR